MPGWLCARLCAFMCAHPVCCLRVCLCVCVCMCVRRQYHQVARRKSCWAGSEGSVGVHKIRLALGKSGQRRWRRSNVAYRPGRWIRSPGRGLLHRTALIHARAILILAFPEACLFFTRVHAGLLFMLSGFGFGWEPRAWRGKEREGRQAAVRQATRENAASNKAASPVCERWARVRPSARVWQAHTG